MKAQIETVSMQEWPVTGRSITRFRAIYRACYRLLAQPDRVHRVQLADVTPAEASKKAHWFFRNHKAFRIVTATEDGWFYMRRAA